MFLVDAAPHKAWVWQLVFIGAYLQAKACSHVFVHMPAIYGQLFPEFVKFCGRSLHLLKSMYGMMYSGKYWFEELQDWLQENGYVQCSSCLALFVKEDGKGSIIKLLDYIDDMIYFSNLEDMLNTFKSSLAAHFNVEFMGHVHWYLSCRICQDMDFSITIDQS
jgi:hypothetical protein